MAAKKKPVKRAKKRVKAGSSQRAAAEKRVAFAYAYIGNGGNATQAAIAAGYSQKTAGSKGEQVLKHVDVQKLIATAAEKAATIAGLTIERHMLEVARLAYADPRKLYRDGVLIPIDEWSDDAAATVASIEADELYGEDDVDEELEPQPHGGALKRARGKTKLIGHTKKLKLWDKNSALVTGARILGMFGKDNEQKGDAAVAALMAAVGLDAGKFAVKP